MLSKNLPSYCHIFTLLRQLFYMSSLSTRKLGKCGTLQVGQFLLSFCSDPKALLSRTNQPSCPTLAFSSFLFPTTRDFISIFLLSILLSITTLQLNFPCKTVKSTLCISTCGASTPKEVINQISYLQSTICKSSSH
jgi:hypothetical protein